MNDQVKKIKKVKNPEKKKTLSGFFKTEKGEYGEGDKFLGVIVPEIRKICKDCPITDLNEIRKMLQNEFHEIRFAALINLIDLYKKSDEENKKNIFRFYIKNAKRINNWDLVDVSAYKILGDFLLKNKGERKILHKLSNSKNLWERRISVISTFAFLKERDFRDLEKIAETLLNDSHDLIHKAVGWMLREAGKIDVIFLLNFLDKNHTKMPRTMLRYSIEKLPDKKRKKYLI